MKMFRKDEGFTLIELMVVVLIIGILIAIAIPVFNGARANAQKRSCFANQRTIDGAAHSYEASNGVLPGVGAGDQIALLQPLLVPSYIATPPACPTDTAKTMGTSYYWNVNGTSTTISCKIPIAVNNPVHGSYIQ